MKACVNGKIVDERKATVSILDYGLLYGFGLYETVLAVNGSVFRLGAHLRRLRAAAGLISVPLPSRDAKLKDMVEGTLRANGLRDAYVRITVTRGAGEPRLEFPKNAKPTIIVLARPLPAGLNERREKGAKIAISRGTRIYSQDIRSGIKSTNFLTIALATLEAKERGVDDVVRLNECGLVAECPTANIFIVSKGRIITPPHDCGMLPGVTREAVLEIAHRIGVPAEEGDITVDMLKGAQEAFKTSSIAGIVPITHVDGRRIGGGRPGPIALGISREYERLVQRESG